MDKRFAYIVLGLLVILYLVCRKDHPEVLQQMQAKAVAVVTGKSAASDATTAAPGADQWDKHRQDVFASRLADSKRRAIAKYPDLAVANSEMNIRFVYRYKLMVKDDNPRLKAPNWPELLADDCAAAVAVHAPTSAPTGKSDKIARTGAAVAATTVATR